MKITITLLCSILFLTGCASNNLWQTQNNTNEQIQVEGDLYYIEDVSTKDDKTFIEIDQIEWLSPSDDTCSTPPEIKSGIPQCNPNGFLIQNSSVDLETYEISQSVNIQTTAFGTNPLASTIIGLQEFSESFISQNEYFEFTPFVIIIEDSTVIAIQERYIP